MSSIQHLGTGRRKTSTARVILRPGTGNFTVNDQKLEQYFFDETHRMLVKRPLEASDSLKKEKRPILVDLYTDWCGWCKKMDKTVYADPTIVALSRNQVFVKLNAEDGGQGEAFARQMGVDGYPTTIILDGQARVLQLSEGYIPSAQAFLELFERARSAR